MPYVNNKEDSDLHKYRKQGDSANPAENGTAVGTIIEDANGNQATISNGNLNVYISDQNSRIVDLYIHKNDNEGLLLANDVLVDTYTVTFTVTPVVGQVVCLRDGIYFYQGKILSVTGNTATLDTPLDYSFEAATTIVCLGSNQLNVNGSTTPQIFHLAPPPGTIWDITRIILHIEDATSMDDGRFGGGIALTRGVVLRRKDGVFQNIFNVKTNGEMAERMYDVDYADNAPAGLYGLRARRTFGGQDKNGVVIRLDGDHNDELQVIIQDDLTGLNTFNIVAQGHVVVP